MTTKLRRKIEQANKAVQNVQANNTPTKAPTGVLVPRFADGEKITVIINAAGAKELGFHRYEAGRNITAFFNADAQNPYYATAYTNKRNVSGKVSKKNARIYEPQTI